MSSNADALRLFGVPRDSVELSVHGQPEPEPEPEFSVPGQPEPEPKPEPEKTKKSTSLHRKRATDAEFFCVRAVTIILVSAVVVVWMMYFH
jgi:hypothetical protein